MEERVVPGYLTRANASIGRTTPLDIFGIDIMERLVAVRSRDHAKNFVRKKAKGFFLLVEGFSRLN